MNKFKKGAKVRRRGCNWNGLIVGEVYTVASAGGSGVDICELHGRANGAAAKYFELVISEREELSKAIDVMKKHDVGNHASKDSYASKFYLECCHAKFLTKEELLDKLFPISSPNEDKLKELEDKQRAIAEEMKLLRESMN